MSSKIAAVGMAVTAALGGAADNAEAQAARSVCDPVYDETQGNSDSSGELRQKIAELKEQGIAVNVQILEDGRPFGIDSQVPGEGARQANEFQAALAEDCDWQNQRTDIVVSLDPRVFDIAYYGAWEKEISDSEFESNKADFRENLQDGSTSFQDDAAELLNDLEQSATEETGGSFPVTEVLIGVGAATFIIGGIWLVRRYREESDEIPDYLEDPTYEDPDEPIADLQEVEERPRRRARKAGTKTKARKSTKTAKAKKTTRRSKRRNQSEPQRRRQRKTETYRSDDDDNDTSMGFGTGFGLGGGLGGGMDLGGGGGGHSGGGGGGSW